MTNSTEFNENDRFSPYFINLSEAIYGKNFQSPGGDDILSKILGTVNPPEGYKNALDIGVGCGGNSIFLNKCFNCPVTGIDINDPILRIAAARIREAGRTDIMLQKRSVLDLDEQLLFDIVLCRDILMYVEDKPMALSKINNAMTTGGKLVILDYCRRADPISQDFSHHVHKGGFSLATIDQYRKLLHDQGFRNIVATDITSLYISYMKKALIGFDNGHHPGNEFLQKDIDYIRKRTSNKIGYCMEGSMVWGLFIAEK